MVGALVTKLSKRKCFTLSENDTLKTTSEKLQKYNIGAMPVLSTQDNNIIGIVSDFEMLSIIIASHCTFTLEFLAFLFT